jgi:hypothetical protein
VKMSKYLGAATCLALFALAACPSQLIAFQASPASSFAPTANSSLTTISSPTPSSPPTTDSSPRPSSQTGYVDGGGELHWTPRDNEPFQIYWYNNLDPCDPSDNLVSDGKSVVTCHVYRGGQYGGSYAYDVAVGQQPEKKGEKKKVTQSPPKTPPSGVYIMHVGSCSSCSKPGNQFPSQSSPSYEETSSPPQAGNRVKIECPSNGDQTTVDPLTGPSPLTPGDTVYFEFIGQYPPPPAPGQQPTSLLTITVTSGSCKNLQIVGGGGSCQFGGKLTAYTATAYGGCSPNPNPTLNATSQ